MSSLSKSFSDVLTFGRSGSATYVDSTGTLQTAADGVPRIGHHVYDGSQWVNKGLLLESESRTNLITYSEDFTDASWNEIRASITADAIASPDGGLNADKLVENTDPATSHFVYHTVSVTASSTYSFSTFFKAGERDWVAFGASGSVFGSTANGQRVYFDVSSGSVGAVGSDVVSYGIEDFGGGWYRCHVVWESSQTASPQIHILLCSDNNTAFYTGDGASGVYIYGAQFEEGSTPSSYIPTSGSTVTRAGETLTVPSDNLPWPEPVVIGDELVTNGTFDTDSDWTLDAASSISGGVLSTAKTTSGEIASQVISITAGKVYKIEYTVISTNGEPLVPRLSGNFASSAPATSTVGTFTAIVTAVSDVDKFAFNVAGGGLTATIDNVSVREINPLAVSIAMEGEVTYADEDALSLNYFLRWKLDSDNEIGTYLDTRLTDTGQVGFWQRENNVFNSAISAADVYSPGINVPFSIASRHGSTFVNGAVDGTALTADTTPTALPDLSSTDLEIGFDFMGTIKSIRIWADDIGDSGIEEASS